MEILSHVSEVEVPNFLSWKSSEALSIRM